MKILFLFVCLPALATTGFSQKSSPVFDNFERSQGVRVYLPEPPAPKFVKKGRGRTGTVPAAAAPSLVRKTVQTKWAVKVTDNLATASGSPYFPAKITMGSAASGLKGFTTGNPLHDTLIVDSSRRYGIDPLLIYSQMHQESSFNIRATSNKGASGLMQLMPGTARRFGVTKIYDPRQNIDAGVRYMRWLLDTFNGDVILALAGYNAGEGAVMKYGWQVPPYRETQEYVRRITTRYTSISDPRYASSLRSVSVGATAAKIEQRRSRPLVELEPTPLAVRLSDGKMMLVNQ